MRHIRLQTLAQILDLPCQNDALIDGYAIDSRAVQPGNLFFALPGKKTDGHHFLFEAAQKGAKAALVSKTYRGKSFGLCLLAVEDVRAALQKLAHRACNERVIAITGSVGKTTTKEFLAHLLSAKYRIFKTEGSFNSQLSLPLALLNKEGAYDFLVLEMGMTERGEIARLVQVAPPEIAVVTKIALAHVAYFPDGLSGIAKAKAEIFSHPKTRLAVVSRQAASLIGAIPCETRFYDLEKAPLCFSAVHLQEDFLAAAAVCRVCGLSDEEIAARAKTLPTVPLRFEMVEKEGITFIKDCYNANPESMRAAFASFPKGGKRRLAILGSMVELGAYSEKEHRAVGELAAECVDELFCLGEDCRAMVEPFEKKGKRATLFSSLELLKIKMEKSMQKGDIVLVKGSKIHKLWELF
jgi:UDP-N-acetylmuramoyl-tripeptide--D-alanyl-D-alanine ligase